MLPGAAPIPRLPHRGRRGSVAEAGPFGGAARGGRRVGGGGRGAALRRGDSGGCGAGAGGAAYASRGRRHSDAFAGGGAGASGFVSSCTGSAAGFAGSAGPAAGFAGAAAGYAGSLSLPDIIAASEAAAAAGDLQRLFDDLRQRVPFFSPKSNVNCLRAAARIFGYDAGGARGRRGAQPLVAALCDSLAGQLLEEGCGAPGTAPSVGGTRGSSRGGPSGIPNSATRNALAAAALSAAARATDENTAPDVGRGAAGAAGFVDGVGGDGSAGGSARLGGIRAADAGAADAGAADSAGPAQSRNVNPHTSGMRNDCRRGKFASSKESYGSKSENGGKGEGPVDSAFRGGREDAAGGFAAGGGAAGGGAGDGGSGSGSAGGVSAVSGSAAGGFICSVSGPRRSLALSDVVMAAWAAGRLEARHEPLMRAAAAVVSAADPAPGLRSLRPVDVANLLWAVCRTGFAAAGGPAGAKLLCTLVAAVRLRFAEFDDHGAASVYVALASLEPEAQESGNVRLLTPGRGGGSANKCVCAAIERRANNASFSAEGCRGAGHSGVTSAGCDAAEACGCCASAACAATCACGADGPLLAALHRHIDTFDVRRLCNFAWAAARLSWNDAEILSHVFGRLRGQARAMLAQHVSNVFWAVAQLRFIPALPLLRELAEYINSTPRILQKQSAQGIANIMWSVGRLAGDLAAAAAAAEAKHEELLLAGESRPLPRQGHHRRGSSGCDVVKSAGPARNARSLSMEVRMKNPTTAPLAGSAELRNLPSAPPPSSSEFLLPFGPLQQLMHHLALEAVPRVPRFVPQHAGSIAWACAKANVCHPPLFHALCEYLQFMAGGLDPQHLSNILFGLGRMAAAEGGTNGSVGFSVAADGASDLNPPFANAHAGCGTSSVALHIDRYAFSERFAGFSWPMGGGAGEIAVGEDACRPAPGAADAVRHMVATILSDRFMWCNVADSLVACASLERMHPVVIYALLKKATWLFRRALSRKWKRGGRGLEGAGGEGAAAFRETTSGNDSGRTAHSGASIRAPGESDAGFSTATAGDAAAAGNAAAGGNAAAASADSFPASSGSGAPFPNTHQLTSICYSIGILFKDCRAIEAEKSKSGLCLATLVRAVGHYLLGTSYAPGTSLCPLVTDVKLDAASSGNTPILEDAGLETDGADGFLTQLRDEGRSDVTSFAAAPAGARFRSLTLSQVGTIIWACASVRLLLPSLFTSLTTELVKRLLTREGILNEGISAVSDERAMWRAVAARQIAALKQAVAGSKRPAGAGSNASGVADIGNIAEPSAPLAVLAAVADFALCHAGANSSANSGGSGTAAARAAPPLASRSGGCSDRPPPSAREAPAAAVDPRENTAYLTALSQTIWALGRSCHWVPFVVEVAILEILSDALRYCRKSSSNLWGSCSWYFDKAPVHNVSNLLWGFAVLLVTAADGGESAMGGPQPLLPSAAGRNAPKSAELGVAWEVEVTPPQASVEHFSLSSSCLLSAIGDCPDVLACSFCNCPNAQRTVPSTKYIDAGTGAIHGARTLNVTDSPTNAGCPLPQFAVVAFLSVYALIVPPLVGPSSTCNAALALGPPEVGQLIQITLACRDLLLPRLPPPFHDLFAERMNAIFVAVLEQISLDPKSPRISDSQLRIANALSEKVQQHGLKAKSEAAVGHLSTDVLILRDRARGSAGECTVALTYGGKVAAEGLPLASVEYDGPWHFIRLLGDLWNEPDKNAASGQKASGIQSYGMLPVKQEVAHDGRNPCDTQREKICSYCASKRIVGFCTAERSCVGEHGSLDYEGLASDPGENRGAGSAPMSPGSAVDRSIFGSPSAQSPNDHRWVLRNFQQAPARRTPVVLRYDGRTLLKRRLLRRRLPAALNVPFFLVPEGEEAAFVKDRVLPQLLEMCQAAGEAAGGG